MPPAARAALLHFLARAARARATSSVTVTGACACLSTCERTLDSPFVPWCVTSYAASLNATDAGACGSFYSSSRAGFWAPCTVNVTGQAAGVGASSAFQPLTTFGGMFVYITAAAAGGCAAAYGAVGLMAALRGSAAPLRALLWMPATAAAAGALHGVFVGAPAAALLAFLYLSLPYAIDAAVAVALGLTLAAFAVFAAASRAGVGAD
jgi:hypothetical protein